MMFPETDFHCSHTHTHTCSIRCGKLEGAEVILKAFNDLGIKIPFVIPVEWSCSHFFDIGALEKGNYLTLITGSEFGKSSFH